MDDDLDEQHVTQYVPQYLIPANVTARWELFPGFGWAEALPVAIAFILGVVLFFGLTQITKTTIINPKTAPIMETIGAKLNSQGLYVKVTPVIPTMIRFIILILPPLQAFFFVKREPSTNMSLIQKYKSARALKQKQRLYLYKYGSGTEG